MSRRFRSGGRVDSRSNHQPRRSVQAVHSGRDTSDGSPEDLRVSRQAIERHRSEVVQAVIPGIKGIAAYTAEPTQEHFKLMLSWYSRPYDNSWPIARGEIEGSAVGGLTVRLFVEDKVEWHYLLQHLADTSFQSAVLKWKRAMASDLRSRLALLNRVIHGVSSEFGLPRSERSPVVLWFWY